jgi:hypothetical protein
MVLLKLHSNHFVDYGDGILLKAPFDTVSAPARRTMGARDVDAGLVWGGESKERGCMRGWRLIWCKNYVVTPYSAEIVNTLTNVLFMYLAFKGIRSCLVNGHDTVYLVVFLGYLLVGTGSFLFHTTLKCTFNPTLKKWAWT